MSSKDAAQWNTSNTWRAEVTVLGAKGKAGCKEGFDGVRDLQEGTGKTL